MDAISIELPFLETYCDFTPLEVEIITNMIFANSTARSMSENELSQVLGITITGGFDSQALTFLEIFSDDESLYDAVIELEIKVRSQEESTWWNITTL